MCSTRKVLFKTVDGKNVYENTKVFVIVDNAKTGALTRDIVSHRAHEHSGGLRYGFVQARAFSNKPEAVKHINNLLLKVNKMTYITKR